LTQAPIPETSKKRDCSRLWFFSILKRFRVNYRSVRKPDDGCRQYSRTLHSYSNTLRILCAAFQTETDGGDFRCEKRLLYTGTLDLPSQYSYTPTLDSNGESGLKITWPDGTVSIAENYIGEELNTYYWDRRESPSYPNTSDAQVTHWLLDPTGNLESGVMSYTHQPLEGPTVTWPVTGIPEGSILSNYPGAYSVAGTNDGNPEDNFTHDYTGTLDLPSQVYRALASGGTTEEYQYTYNPLGKVLTSIDPVNRSFSNSYDGNDIDLLEVQDGNGNLLAKYTYNTQHEPLTHEDGSGNTTTYTYNAAGQIQTLTQPSPGGTTTFNYNTNGQLTSIQGPLAGTANVTSFTYDGFGRLNTVSDSEGYTLTFAYDAYDRPTTVTYPDGTYEQTTWVNLDPAFLRDRLGNWTQQQFDSLRQLVSETDP
jgi:YD repeat-containing protein